jgi:hypothetical protein
LAWILHIAQTIPIHSLAITVPIKLYITGGIQAPIGGQNLTSKKNQKKLYKPENTPYNTIVAFTLSVTQETNMLTFKVTSTCSFTMADYDVHYIENHLLKSLPKATYRSISSSESYTITREQAQRIMKVTHIKDHKDLLWEFIAWNTQPKRHQRVQHGKGDNFCEISTGLIGGQFYISIYRESTTESCYLTLMHDTEQVMMDIQLP